MPVKNYILSLDEGTTGARALLFDRQERVIASAYREIRCSYPQPSYVEQDPEELYAAQCGAMAEVVARSGIFPKEIATIGIACQRETTVVWEKESGKPIFPAIVWQCRRTAGDCEKLKEEGLSALIREKTGLLPDAYFSATKLKWILDHVEGARSRAQKGELLFGTVDSYLIWKLTGGKVHATDRTNASRTMLYNIHTLCWDKELLALFDIPEEMLPTVLPSSSFFGYCTAFGTPIPICGVAGDQQAALFGQGCTEEGQVKNTYGTGCFLLMHTGHKAVCSSGGLLTTLAADEGKQPSYVLEGSVFTAGAVIKWLRDDLKLIETAGETAAIAQSVPNNGGVYFVPAFTGLGAPYWDMFARGAILGLSAGCGKGHMVRAALECLAYRTYDLLESIRKDTSAVLSELRVDGGAVQNDFLMQFQADILNIPVFRPDNPELTALGAFRLAALQTDFPSPAERKTGSKGRIFLPRMSEEERQKNLSGWAKAVRCICSGS